MAHRLTPFLVTNSNMSMEYAKTMNFLASKECPSCCAPYSPPNWLSIEDCQQNDVNLTAKPPNFLLRKLPSLGGIQSYTQNESVIYRY